MNELWEIRDTLGKTIVVTLSGKSVTMTNRFRDPVVVQDGQTITLRFAEATLSQPQTTTPPSG